ncbi:MAG: ribosome maturation factor RimM [Acidimicrobiales bacterium]
MAGGASELLEVGRVVKPHGLGGEVVVELVTHRFERLAPGSVLTTGRGRLEVGAVRPHQGRFLVTFVGVDSREDAERLREVRLLAPPLEDPDELWVHEVIGAEVVDVAGAGHGSVVAVEANPASDLLVLEGGGLVPVHFVVEASPGRVTVDLPPGLLDR